MLFKTSGTDFCIFTPLYTFYACGNIIKVLVFCVLKQANCIAYL